MSFAIKCQYGTWITDSGKFTIDKFDGGFIIVYSPYVSEKLFCLKHFSKKEDASLMLDKMIEHLFEEIYIL